MEHKHKKEIARRRQSIVEKRGRQFFLLCNSINFSYFCAFSSCFFSIFYDFASWIIYFLCCFLYEKTKPHPGLLLSLRREIVSTSDPTLNYSNSGKVVVVDNHWEECEHTLWTLLSPITIVVLSLAFHYSSNDVASLLSFTHRTHSQFHLVSFTDSFSMCFIVVPNQTAHNMAQKHHVEHSKSSVWNWAVKHTETLSKKKQEKRGNGKEERRTLKLQ